MQAAERRFPAAVLLRKRQMVNIYLCDNDIQWLEKATQMLNKYAVEKRAEIQVKCFSDPQSLFDADVTAPDVLFCDIEFERCPSAKGDADALKPAGIDAVNEINRIFPNCQVVYVTDTLDYVLDVYQTDHMWYVLKDQFRDRLPGIVDKYERINRKRKSDLVIRTADGLTAMIPCRDILYLERRDRKTVIVTYNRRYEVRDRISDILDKLTPGRFVRCHNSFAVNMEKIREIRPRSVLMKNGAEIIISRGYSKSFRDEYHDWAESRTVK